MIVYNYNTDGFLSSTKNVDDDYVLIENETLLKPSSDLMKPKFEGDTWIEGEDVASVETLVIDDLNARHELVLPVLKLGAKRIASGFVGSGEIVDTAILFATNKYLWAKGELKTVSKNIDTLYLIELVDMNKRRVAENKRELTVQEYKEDIIIEDFEIRQGLLNTFNVYIDMASSKLSLLIREKIIDRSTIIINYMEAAADDITQAEAERILTLILQA